MTWYAQAFAAGYDRFNCAAERAWLGRRRDELLAQARGVVLELGAGTGANFRHYPAEVTRVVATEPDLAMWSRAMPRRGLAPVPVHLVAASAGALPVADGSVDTVVTTLVLCTVPDLHAALREARRVLRPAGRLLFLEHGGADGRRGAWQHRLDPIWKHLARGCHLSRRAVDAMRTAGFEIIEVERFDPPAPPILRPFSQGVATPA